MPLNLYFPNQELRTCQKVKNVTGQPVEYDVTRKSDVYRNSFEGTKVNPEWLASAGGGVASNTPSTISVQNGFVDAAGSVMTANTLSAKSRLSDEEAGIPLRQDPIKFTHWKVPVAPAAEGEPDYMLVSISEYPDGYSNCPPSWWEDPNPTND